MSCECAICRENKEEFWTCSVCQNGHCLDCHEEIQLRRSRCPFCRELFAVDNDCQDLLSYSFRIGNIHFIYRRTNEDSELLRLVLEFLTNYNEYEEYDDW